jgi:hypothetical protein
LVAPLEKSRRELVLEKDGPARLVMPPEIQPEKMQEVVREMNDAFHGNVTASPNAFLIRRSPLHIKCYMYIFAFHSPCTSDEVDASP